MCGSFREVSQNLTGRERKKKERKWTNGARDRKRERRGDRWSKKNSRKLLRGQEVLDQVGR